MKEFKNSAQLCILLRQDSFYFQSGPVVGKAAWQPTTGLVTIKMTQTRRQAVRMKEKVLPILFQLCFNLLFKFSFKPLSIVSIDCQFSFSFLSILVMFKFSWNFLYRFFTTALEFSFPITILFKTLFQLFFNYL